jgi:hypothetical protein
MSDQWQNRIIGHGNEAPDQLLANPRNFRTHPKHQQDALAGVLREVGVVQDVIVNQRTGFLLDGHLRVSLALREGQPTIPVKYVDLSEAEEALVLATLDPISALAGTDAAKLDELLREVSTGDATVQQMLDELAQAAGIVPGLAEPGDDPVVEVDDQKPTRTRPGDIWKVGRHAIACIDSTNQDAIKMLVAGQKPRMVVADPPYGIDIVAADSAGGDKPFGSKPVVGTVGADNIVRAGRYLPVIGDDSIDTAVSAATGLLGIYPKATHFWWGANNYAHALSPSTCWIVWDKDNTGNFADAELAWSNHDSAVRIFKHQWNGMIRESERGKRSHPTQKPIALFVWIYEKYGAAGDVILDPFLGSGPSLKAAEDCGRTVIGCELSPHYCDHILEWAEARGLAVAKVEG